MVYLASPYSSPVPAVREARFRLVCRKAAELMRAGHKIFSPIAHTHPIAVAGELPLGFDFWSEYDREFLEFCDEVWVLCLDGWEESKGVAAEIDIATKLGKPIRYLEGE